MSETAFKVIIADSISEHTTIEAEMEVLSRIEASVTQYDCHTEDEIIAVGHDADALMVMLARTPITSRVIEALTRCKIIARCGIGVDNVDLDAATERGILVTNVPDYCIDEVSAHAVALLLACARRIVFMDKMVRHGGYDSAAARPVHRLTGSTVGLVGFGRIGQSVAHKLRGFGLRLLACDPFVPDETVREYGVEPVELEKLLRESDYVSLHVPVTPNTRHLIGAEQLSMMKPTAFLINTSRGGLIDQGALIQALQDGTIAGAGLDVLEQEPPAPDDPLLRLDNVTLTPHMAYYSEAALRDAKRLVAEEVLRVLSGQPPRNAVNEVAWLNAQKEG